MFNVESIVLTCSGIEDSRNPIPHSYIFIPARQTWPQRFKKRMIDLMMQAGENVTFDDQESKEEDDDKEEDEDDNDNDKDTENKERTKRMRMKKRTITKTTKTKMTKPKMKKTKMMRMTKMITNKEYKDED